MTAIRFGRLERVELRTAWLNEAGDFTPWLAREENLDLLGETLGIDLELDGQERNVGPFRADILCKDTASDHWVLIENQLERTDHGHLGQLLTYAAGLDAVTIVWVAARFTEEHRAALDWLNEKTHDSVNFFGLEIELWRIGDSQPAPKFNIVSQPNDWTATTIPDTPLTPTKELQRQYWEAFGQELAARSFIRPTKGLPQYWMNLSAGKSGTQLMASVSSREPWVQAAFVINDPKKSAVWYPLLREQRAEIERELGAALPWDDPPGGYKESRMALRLHADCRDRGDWPRQHAWLRENLESLHRVFAPRIKSLPALSSTVASPYPADVDGDNAD